MQIKSLLLVLGLPIVLSTQSFARPIQIIHTNDLHSHLDHATDPGRGGYANVFRVIEALKAQAAANGFETLLLDAGDNLEGGQFYFADQGYFSLKAMDSMGYDAIALGNHDYQMGSAGLDNLYRLVNPQAKILAANFHSPPHHKNLRKHMAPFVSLERAGLKIAVLGLTTSEKIYNWLATDSKITKPIPEAKKYVAHLKATHDAVIALTHIGTKVDRQLVKKVPGLDLVVGGHSHTFLHKPVVAYSKHGYPVPIVQTGEHGNYVGDLLVDIEPGKPLQILRYQLIPVLNNPPAEGIQQGIQRDAIDAISRSYGPKWIDESIGESEIWLENPERKPSVWGNIVADAYRESVRADVAVSITNFYGNGQPPGPITRFNLMNLYPRQFEFTEKYGWNIYTSEVSGAWLKLLIEAVVKTGNANIFALSGIDLKLKKRNNKTVADQIWIHGRKINVFRRYTVALPEAIIRGALGLSPAFKLIFKDIRNTQIPVWHAVEQKIKSLGVIRDGSTRPRLQDRYLTAHPDLSVTDPESAGENIDALVDEVMHWVENK